MISRKDDDDEDDYDNRKFHLTTIGQNVAHVHTHILRQKESTYVCQTENAVLLAIYIQTHTITRFINC